MVYADHAQDAGGSGLGQCQTCPECNQATYAQSVANEFIDLTFAGGNRVELTGGRRRRMHKGADNPYKEFKIATFYNESNEHRQVIANAG